MRFLVLSPGADAIGLCIRLQNEGHEPAIWIRDSDCEHNGEGLVRRADGKDLTGTVVADCTGFGALLDRMEFDGAKTCCGSSLADRLETDREYADEVMREAGIETPVSKSFTDWGAAEKFVQEGDERLVFKPEGSLAGAVPSYVPADNRELLEAMDYFRSKVGSGEVRFTLQEFIEGTAVSTEGWFDGEKWSLPFNHTIERKQFLDGDLGPSGGCTGNLVWPCGADDPIVVEGIAKLEGFLKKHRYRGPIDLNAVVNESGLYGLEFTPRMGWDAFPTMLYGLFDGDFGKFLYDIARGNGPEKMPLNGQYAAGVRISTPPWPTEKHHAEAGLPIRGINKETLRDSLYAYEISEQDGKYVTSGGVGIVGVSNARGESPGEAFAKVYKQISEIKIPDMQYRTDLYEQCFKDYLKLENVVRGVKDEGWIGVDLDGTLARYDGDHTKIGVPVPRMVNRVKRWLDEGKQVRIVTARAAKENKDRVNQLVDVHDWLNRHVAPLPVQAEKEPQMVELWDDRSVPVEEGTGVVA